ncbi:MAG: hypothetical protein Q7S95_01650 [bacterium]|nr:hypothetical protein [bacterium]
MSSARLPIRAALLVGLACALPALAGAQTLGAATPFTLSVAPSNPVPYGRATVTPVPNQVDIANATMTVTVGGKKVVSGNAGPATITLGAPGVPVVVVVRLTSAGSTYTEQVTITPQGVVLVAEPLSSAPPLYKGKSLVPTGGSVRVVAVADMRSAAGKRIDPDTLSYAWTVDDVDFPSASGIGRKTAIIDSPLPYRSQSIVVTVVSQDGRQVGGASIDLASTDPSVRIYERDPLLGIRFDHALTSPYALPGAEVTLYAGLFSFPTALRAPSLQWFVNGVLAETSGFITLRPTGSGEGTASLSVNGAAGSEAIASSDLTISFGSANRSNLFGL